MSARSWWRGVAVALVAAAVLCGCSQPRPETRPPVTPAAQEADLSNLEIPRDGVADASVAATSQAEAIAVVTDGPATFYRVTTGKDAWFAVEPGARVLAWSTQPGTDVDIAFVPRVGGRRVVVSELERPLSTPDENTVSGGAGQTYITQGDDPVDGGWLVVTSRTYDNGDGDVGLQVKSAWK